MSVTLFKVGDSVWHDKYGRGEVAEQGITEVAVMFDNAESNVFVSTEPPPFILKRDLQNLPWQERLEWAEAKKICPLNEHIIWWDLESNPDPALENPKIKSYNYPPTSGYFKVDKVLRTVGMKWNTEEQRFEFFVKSDQVDISITSTKGGQKYKVTLKTKEAPVLPTARVVPSDSLARIQDTPGWTLPEPEVVEEPEKPEVSEDESK